MRPGLDCVVRPGCHMTTHNMRDGWRFGDRRWLIAQAGASPLSVQRGGFTTLGGAKGLSGAACGVSLGRSG